jgi:hypothetical protein
MALTTETLAAVEGLTDAQRAAIISLSANDEDRVISAKTRELHNLYDDTFSSLLGVKKRDGEKSTVFWAEQMKALKDQAQAADGTLKTQLETLRAEKEALEAKIKGGKGTEALEQQLADKDNLIKQLQGKVEETAKEWQGKYEQATAEASQIRIEHEFDKALTGVKFKPDSIIPSEVRGTFIENAKASLLNQYQPDWVDDGKGGKKLVFRKEGEIARNPDNMLNPYSPAELLAKALTPILDTGKMQPGAGTEPGSNGSGAVSLGAARTQAEAAELLTQDLMKLGLARGTDAYQAQFDKAWADNNVAALPIQ